MNLRQQLVVAKRGWAAPRCRIHGNTAPLQLCARAAIQHQHLAHSEARLQPSVCAGVLRHD
jgi:hypothetical protein